MQDFQLRVIQERDELKTKWDALNKFFEGKVYKTLPEIERDDLLDQADYMEAYLSVLNRRIERFS